MISADAGSGTLVDDEQLCVTRSLRIPVQFGVVFRPGQALQVGAEQVDTVVMFVEQLPGGDPNVGDVNGGAVAFPLLGPAAGSASGRSRRRR